MNANDLEIENYGATCLDLLETKMYRHLFSLAEHWKNYAYFTPQGGARLGSIAGYITALKHLGKQELAEQMAEDFITKMAWLTRVNYNSNSIVINHQESMIETQLLFSAEDTSPVNIRVPRQKVILHDDGCLHSFNFVVYFPLDYKLYWECFKKHAEEKQNPHQSVVEELKIETGIRNHEGYEQLINEHAYKNGYKYTQYYTYGYNGGLIYHGPDAGETFSVCVQKNVLWSIHT